MDAQYWHDKWQADQLGFDQAQPNALMVASDLLVARHECDKVSNTKIRCNVGSFKNMVLQEASGRFGFGGSSIAAFGRGRLGADVIHLSRAIHDDVSVLLRYSSVLLVARRSF